jgi:hypothetical protein
MKNPTSVFRILLCLPAGKTFFFPRKTKAKAKSDNLCGDQKQK